MLTEEENCLTEIVGIRFKNAGKIYYFDPDGEKLVVGDPAIVETARGVEFGWTELSNRLVEDEDVVQPLKKIIRKASHTDIEQEGTNRLKEREALSICLQKIQDRGLKMKLIDVELTFDLNKIIFYFTADGRVDFRELVKDLAAIFRMRIELRQIGVRDEAKIMSGIGICGRGLCCSKFLSEFQPVSIKMAKDQNLSLNPTKISGICGRLMCCLKYEEETYEYLNHGLPHEGDLIDTADGKGEVLSINVLRRIVKAAVRKRAQDAPVIGYYPVEQIKVVRSSKNKENEIENSEELNKILDAHEK